MLAAGSGLALAAPSGAPPAPRAAARCVGHCRPTAFGNRAVIREVADIRIQPGQQAAFEEAIQRALATVMVQAKGARRWRVDKGIENPERYVLQIDWETLEDHTVGFRQGPLFAQWRAIIGPFFAAPPHVEHFVVVAEKA